MRIARLMVASCAVFALNACATHASLRDHEGVTRQFTGPYEDVRAAARYSVETLNVRVNSTESPSQYTHNIWFEKPVSAWSNGEVGLVIVERETDSMTSVEVRSQKRSTYQLSGTDQDEFARLIFEGIEKGLTDLATQ